MKRPLYEVVASVVVVAVFATGCVLSPAPSGTETTASSDTGSDWQEKFDISTCTLATTGQNQYFILEPGFQIVLEGGKAVVSITVLEETVDVDGVKTRVVEEREWKNGELIEVSRNFYAICEETQDVFYFGEEVDMYTGGKVSSHSGAWRAGEGNARAGLIMPGNPRVGMKYYQEIAPGVAMDRAEILSLDETLGTPAGNYSNCLKTREGTALNPAEREFKTYAPGIGLIQDANLLLTKHGFIDRK